jgi:hypothetical protein
MKNPTLTIDADGARYSVTFDRFDALQTNRARWCWTIGETVGAPIAEGSDLTTVCDVDEHGYPRPILADALATLLSFLGAAIDGHEHEQRTGHTSETADLFPRSLYERLSIDGDYLSSLAEEIRGAA